MLSGPNRIGGMSNAQPLFRDRYVRIINTVTQKGLLAGSWGTKVSDPNVWQYPLTSTGSTHMASSGSCSPRPTGTI